MALPLYPLMSEEEYLVLDRNSPDVRYEYFDGEVRMRAGRSANHSIIATNIATFLHRALRDTPCVVYNSEQESRSISPVSICTCPLKRSMQKCVC